MRHLNDRGPNFRDKSGQLFLVRCFSCGGKRGRENWAPAVATGTCAWCGWEEFAGTQRTDDSMQSEESVGTQKRTDDNLRSVFG